jgi:plastocyanin
MIARLLCFLCALNAVRADDPEESPSVPVTYSYEWTSPMDTTMVTMSTVDSVNFEWDDSAHNLMQCADADSMSNCDCSTELAATSSSGSYTFSSDTEGTYYFICSVGDHCQEGQYMAITVYSEGACEDKKAADKCSKFVKKGKCSKVMDKCEASCGGCGAYESCDEDTESSKKCKKITKKGKCIKSSWQKKCATSCFSEVGC